MGEPFSARPISGRPVLPLRDGHVEMPKCTASAILAPISMPKMLCRADGAASTW